MNNQTPPPPPFGMRVAGAALAGVCVVQMLPVLPALAVSSVTCALALAWSFTTARWRLAMAFIAGFAWACVVGQWVMAQRLPAELSRTDFMVEGVVLGLPQRGEESLRFDFRIESGEVGAPVGRRVRLGWYGEGGETLRPGSRWRMLVRLRRPQGVLNAGGLDFEKSALAHRIAATGYVRDPSSARALSGASGIDAWRDGLSAAIGRRLPEGRGRFVQALAVGDTRGLSDEDWETLRATGLTHQIAISGFHVGMVAGLGALLVMLGFKVLPGLGRWLPRPQACALGALLFAFGYTALAGFALPTVRTLLMITVVLLAKWLRRAQTGRESFALALIAVLAMDPLSVLSPGFWLSFVGVAWLLWCLPHGDRAGRLRQFLQAQGVAVLGLLPLGIWFFGQASLPGPLANLVGVPLIGLLVVPLSLAGMGVHPAWPEAAAALWQAAAWVMGWLWALLESIAAIPAATIWLPEATPLSMSLACLGAAWLLLPRGVPGKPLATLLLLPMLWPRLDLPQTGEADIRVIDVGQGLAVLVRTSRHQLLYDAGPAGARGPDMGEAAVVPSLRALGIGRMDTLLASHGDNDHAGGMAAVRRAFPHARMLGVEGWARPGMGLCRSTQRWRWDGVDFEVLHPPPFFPYERNDSSCVLRISIGDRSALLPGDIGRHVEARLVREHGARLKADLLLVPHHGSNTSSTAPFIAAVAPRWAVFSTGAGNRFGLPRDEVVRRYRQAGATTLDSASTGALHFRLDAAGTQLISARRQERRYWRESP